MSTPPPADNDPKVAAKKEQGRASLWTVLAAVFAGFLFVQYTKVEAGKQTFYAVAGGAAVAVAVVNGFAAYAASQKAKK